MATYTLQPDATAGKDAYIVDTSPTTNFGTNIVIQAKFNKPLKTISSVRRSLIEFDLSAFPGASGDITSAKLTLDCLAANSAEGAKLRRVTQSAWTEAGVTWNTYDGTNNWTTAGGDYTTTDQVSWTTPGATGDFDITGLATLTVDAIDNRSSKLILIMMLDDETTNSTRGGEWASSDHTTENKPLLTIEYTVAGTRRIFIC